MSLRRWISDLKKWDQAYLFARAIGKSFKEAIHLARQENFQKASRDLKNLTSIKGGVIVDVGANRGQFISMVKTCYNPSLIISFEPLPSAFAELKSKFSEPGVLLKNMALGEKPGEVEFEVNTHDQASSILPIRQNGDLLFTQRDLSPLKKIVVEVQTLDGIFWQEKIESIELLKMDVQGYELQVLKGAIKALKYTKCILTEISFYPQYEGNSEFEEVHHFLKKSGFYLHAIDSPQTSAEGIVLQADAIYKRKV